MNVKSWAVYDRVRLVPCVAEAIAYGTQHQPRDCYCHAQIKRVGQEGDCMIEGPSGKLRWALATELMADAAI